MDTKIIIPRKPLRQKRLSSATPGRQNGSSIIIVILSATLALLLLEQAFGAYRTNSLVGHLAMQWYTERIIGEYLLLKTLRQYPLHSFIDGATFIESYKDRSEASSELTVKYQLNMHLKKVATQALDESNLTFAHTFKVDFTVSKTVPANEDVSLSALTGNAWLTLYSTTNTMKLIGLKWH